MSTWAWWRNRRFPRAFPEQAVDLRDLDVCEAGLSEELLQGLGFWGLSPCTGLEPPVQVSSIILGSHVCKAGILEKLFSGFELWRIGILAQAKREHLETC